MFKFDVIKKVISVLESIDLGSTKGISQLNSFSTWVDNLSNSGIITSVEYYFISSLVKVKLESAKLALEVKMSNTVNEPLKGLVEVVSNIILEYFVEENKGNTAYNRCYTVYDLPLNINLIEAHVFEGINCVKVYLQRPGLFIGRCGRCIDAITDKVKEVLGLKDFRILIVETFGPSRFGHD